MPIKYIFQTFFYPMVKCQAFSYLTFSPGYRKKVGTDDEPLF